jgi:hypothetical protein|tara:strand:- start:5 stop:403 length:399 start_codon:yes stop_codon:yes gene_type:complete
MNNKLVSTYGIIVDGWEIIPSDAKEGLFMEEMWVEEEQQIIHDMLKLFIPEEYGYYFSETHEHDEPEDIPHGEDVTGSVWKRVYRTPLPLYHETGEYNCIDVAYTEDYTYYAISLHGCSFASALTEYVRVAK